MKMPEITKKSKSNLEFLRQLKDENHYTYKELSEITEYSEEYVRAWFSPQGGTKFRLVPDRAVSFARLKTIKQAS
jgi:hypothetical protein